MLNEFRIYGPPGTGKTTTLAKYVQKAADKFGPEKIMIASLTKAAAGEIAGRDLPIQDDQIGTLHKFALRALGKPPIAETAPLVYQWNSAYPQYALSAKDGKCAMNEPLDFEDREPGGKLLAEMNILRAQLVPRDLWPSYITLFADKWDEFKCDTGSVDFTGMIEEACKTPEAPGYPTVAIMDELQDFSALEIALIRHWAGSMKHLIMALDDDQAIYTWRGADPNLLLGTDIPADRKYVLSQSYRVPKSIHRMASAWITRLQYREPKEYLPRNAQGDTRVNLMATYKYPEPIIAMLENLEGAGMVLASCKYMLDPITTVLKRNLIPFHNPYRTSERQWNPLGTKSCAAILDYLRPCNGDRLWTTKELKNWLDTVEVDGVLERGVKAELKNTDDARVFMFSELHRMFKPGVMDYLIDNKFPLVWLRQHILASKKVRMEFPLAVAEKHGASKLAETPKLTIGTIHSVKGGEADTVYLFPDLSGKGYYASITGAGGNDAITRLMYVGMTRARSNLILCNPANPRQTADCWRYL